MPKGSIGSIRLDLLIGVCREICIPAQAQLEITGDQLFKTDPTAQRIVSFSKLRLPETRSAQEVGLTVAEMEAGIAHVSFAAPKGTSTSELFVEGPSNWALEPAIFLFLRCFDVQRGQIADLSAFLPFGLLFNR